MKLLANMTCLSAKLSGPEDSEMIFSIIISQKSSCHPSERLVFREETV